MKKQTNTTIVYVLITITMFLALMMLIDNLFDYNYIKECFDTNTTHDVDLPINTKYSCENMSGPPGRCSLTGTQCLSDIDCYGCQPNTSPDLSNTFLNKNKKIIGYDGAGKQSYLAPMYSPLTHDPVYNSKVMTSDPYAMTPTTYTGFDTWTAKAADMREIYDFTYLPSEDTPYLSTYPLRYSATGQFKYTGPYASNASLRPYYESLDKSDTRKM